MVKFLVKSFMVVFICVLALTAGVFVGNIYRIQQEEEKARQGCADAKKYRDTHIPATDLELQVYNLNEQLVEICEQGGM